MRLLLDTNVVVAALLWNGPPRRLLERAVDPDVEFFSSRVPLPRVVINDPDDDHVIAAAMAARAALIVTGDRKHLLPMGSHEGIRIVTAVQALASVGVSGSA